VKDQSRDRERLTSMGYETISRAARVSKRNAAAIVQRLIQKGFIEVSAPP
jgi:DNA-binding MarR family transcriptional regulator